MFLINNSVSNSISWNLKVKLGNRIDAIWSWSYGERIFRNLLSL